MYNLLFTKMSAEPRFIFKTRDGTRIPVYEIMPIPERLINAVNKRFRNLYGEDNERRPFDHAYNCHGMVFIGKHGWVGIDFPIPKKVEIFLPQDEQDIEESKVDNDIIAKILDGNGLKMIKRLDNIELDFLEGDENVKIGDIVVYKAVRQQREEILHSAIVMDLIKVNDRLCNLKVLSKMGYGGEYFHFFNKVPNDDFGKIVEIWTDREVEV
jgi:hypothetical protein